MTQWTRPIQTLELKTGHESTSTVANPREKAARKRIRMAAAAAARVSRWHTICPIAVTEVHKAITTQTIPTMVLVAGNNTQPIPIQVRVDMEDKVDMPLAKVSHDL